MRLALAHEYFVAHGGAERVVETFHQMWPEAPVYTFFHDRGRYGDLPGWTLRTSYLQHLLLGESHRLLLPLYPNAARALRLPPETDLALISTSAFIKGISLPDRTVAVAYCHSPTRYLYDWSDRYLQEEVPAPLIPLVRDLLGRLREDDQRAARRLDRWMANSTAVQRRIQTYYGVPVETIEVVHPPVDVDSFTANTERGDFWLFVGRLSAYKRADVAVRAFNDTGLRLLVVGEGRERGALPGEIAYVIGNDCRVGKVYGAVFPIVWRAFHHFSRLFIQLEKVAYYPPMNRLSHRVFYKLLKEA